MRKFLLASILFVPLIAAPAMAADVVVMGRQPVAFGAFSWTSWYVGGLVGGARSDQANTSFAGEVVSYSMSTNAIAGVTAGYNYQIPGSAIVFGFETEFGYLHLTGSSPFARTPGLVGSTTIGDWYNATALRIGWAWENVLFYGKGGFAASTLETTVLDASGLGPGTGKQDVFGYAWGGGLEYVFNPRWSVKAEYLWLGLNHSVDVCGFPPAVVRVGGTFCSNTATQGVQTFKVGVNYLLDVGPVYDRY